MTLGVRWSTSLGTGVYLIEKWSIVGKVEQARERKQRTSGAVEIVIIKLPAKLATKLQPVIAVHVADDIAKLHRLFGEDARRRFRLVSAEANAIIPQQTLNFDSRNTEVRRAGRFNLVVSKLREVEARFVQQCWRKRAIVKYCISRVVWRGCNVGLLSRRSAGVAANVERPGEIGAERQVIVGIWKHIESRIVLVRLVCSWRGNDHFLNVGYAVEAAATEISK